MAGVISQWFYLVFLFPILIGVGVGWTGEFAVKAGKVRLPQLCGGIGFLAGCFAVVAMHYYEFYTFENSMSDVDEEFRQVARNFDQLQAKRAEQPQAVQELLDDLADGQEFREALAVNGFFSHLDMKARRGVTISSRRGRNPINLGYVGSYIYWGAEAFIIAAIAFYFLLDAASQPFCSLCESWKPSSVVGGFEATSVNVKEALRSGDFKFLAEYSTPSTASLALTLFRCPTCQAESTIDAKLESITVNKKGETSKSKLCTVTYPAEAAAAFDAVFQPKPLPFDVEANESNTPHEPA